MVDKKDAAYIFSKMYLNGSAMSGAAKYHIGYQDDAARYSGWHFAGKYNPTTLPELTFEPYFASSDGNLTRFSHDQSSISLIVMEIAG